MNTKKVRRPHFSGYFLSPLRYPGGKGRLGPWLAQVISANDLKGGWYVEPYAGGAGAALYLLFQEHVDHIVINDADPLIHAFWLAVRDHALELTERIRGTPVTLDVRAELLDLVADPAGHSVVDLAFATFFLNRTSRSGILAGGVIGGKSQDGDYKLDARFKKDDLLARILAIAGYKDRITVLGMDALDLLVYAAPGFPPKTLTYLDPPYYVKGSQLYRNHYSHEDRARIAWCVKRATYPVVVTYDDCSEIRELYAGVDTSRFSLHYSTHLSRPKATEVLFSKNLSLPRGPRLTRSVNFSPANFKSISPVVEEVPN